MNKKCRGFTLVELMIATAIVGVIVALAIFAAKGYDRESNKIWADDEAKNFIQNTYLGGDLNTDFSVSCQETDSDNNGYVSCAAIIRRSKDQKPEVVDLECASKWSISTGKGCRLSKPVIQRRF